jgi:hypothetical protein
MAALAGKGRSPATILVGVRHAQIEQGFPEPRQGATMARLKLVQAGVARNRVNRGMPPDHGSYPAGSHLYVGFDSR